MRTFHTSASVDTWLAEPLPKDVAQAIERVANAEDVRHVAVMPDVHLAAEFCVGLVVATTRLIYPGAVGSDIGCGMAAVRFDAPAELLTDEPAAGRLLAALYRSVPGLKHGRATAPTAIPEELQGSPLSDPRLEKLKHREGRLQLGTLGRGNHFLEFQRDHEGQLWLMLHSGSRSMGQAITAHHAASGGKGMAPLDVDGAAGQAYLNDMAWAIRYAEQNRLAMIESVRRIMHELLGVETVADSLVHCHHNHVLREVHFGEPYWVHRKGALPAFDGISGIVPGSMGTRSFHVRGRGNVASLCSSSHGAGRAMSRREAATQISVRELIREMRGVWFDHRRAQQLRDEAPTAYKDINAVMRAQRELTRVELELQPILSYKG